MIIKVPYIGCELYSVPKNWVPQQKSANGDNDDCLLLSIEVHDWKASDLRITVSDKLICVSASRETSEDKASKLETSWRRSFAVNSQSIDLSQVKAHLSDGVLLVTAPKKPDAVTSSIEVMTDPVTTLEADKALESNDTFALSYEVPGVQAKDLQVILRDGNKIYIDGTRKLHPDEGDAEKRIRYTKSYEVNLKEVDVSHAKAALSDGVLTVLAPQKTKPEPRLIVVNSDPTDDEAKTDDKEQYMKYLDLPGVKSSDFSLKLDDDYTLHIEGCRSVPVSSKNERITRSFRIDPESVDVAQLKATHADGVLVITAPKYPKIEPRNVPITSDNSIDGGRDESNGADRENTADNTLTSSDK